VETGIFKEPVTGPVAVRALGLEGDRQADLRVHGGTYKAVYAYAAEDYAWWSDQLRRELAPGMFGENLTTRGLDEHDTHVGDVLRVGTALLQAVQPRLPCHKLGIRFDDPRMVRRFMRSGRFGVYLRVLEEGTIEVGDEMAFVERDPVAFAVTDLPRLLDPESTDPGEVERALECSALPPEWSDTLRRRLESGAA
jgi:MOSC domain-containing protein YiiM